jgi:chromate transporter
MDQPEPAATATGDSPVTPTRLRDIFWLFFQIGIMSFGGGLSAWLFREIVEKRKWLTATEFLSGLTLVQALPGVNMTNMSVYVGQRLRGVPGVLTALFGLLVGPFFILIGLSSAYHTIDDIAWSHAALAGLATSAVGLLLSMGVKAIRAFKPSIAHIVVLTIIVIAVGALRIPMVPVIIVMAPISVAIAWYELKHKPPADKGRKDASA